jgi:hypothetical protein
VHRYRVGETPRATHEPFDAGLHIDVLAFALLRLDFANRVLLRIEMALVGSPPIRVKPCDAAWRSQCFQLEPYRILVSPKDIREHGPTMVIDRVPSPARLRFLADIAPHRIEFCGQSSMLGANSSARQIATSTCSGGRCCPMA